jgi:hypothetical protein
MFAKRQLHEASKGVQQVERSAGQLAIGCGGDVFGDKEVVNPSQYLVGWCGVEARTDSVHGCPKVRGGASGQQVPVDENRRIHTAKDSSDSNEHGADRKITNLRKKR